MTYRTSRRPDRFFAPCAGSGSGSAGRPGILPVSTAQQACAAAVSRITATKASRPPAASAPPAAAAPSMKPRLNRDRIWALTRTRASASNTSWVSVIRSGCEDVSHTEIAQARATNPAKPPTAQ